MAGRLQGQTAVVTGGARGIGAAIARQLSNEGALVAVLDIDEGGDSFAGQSPSEGQTIRRLMCDVTNEEQVADVISKVNQAYGPITVLINNAGVNAYYDAGVMTSADWDGVFAVDLKAAWLCAKHCLPSMTRAGQGSVINISSIHAYTTRAGMFPYAAAKAGLLGLTRSLALDYAADNIRVNAICPGFIRTHLVDEWLARQDDPAATELAMLRAHPLGRIGEPADVAYLAAFLASDEARYITGATIVVDGGLTAGFSF